MIEKLYAIYISVVRLELLKFKENNIENKENSSKKLSKS